MSRKNRNLINSLFLLITLIPIYTGIYVSNPCGNLENNLLDRLTVNASDLADNWWDVTYLYRTPIAIRNLHSRAIPSDYSLSINIDTAMLITASKLRMDGKDLRVVWYNTTDDTWKELARINLTNFGSNNTEIWFRTVHAIVPNSVDNDYFLYYGCVDPGEPPADKDKVYKKFDDFTQPDGAAEGWIVIEGAGWGVFNNQYRKNKSAGFSITILPDSSIDDAIVEVILKSNGTDFGLGLVWQYKNKAQFYVTLLGYEGNELIIGKMSGQFSILELTGTPESELVSNKWYKLKMHVANSQALIYLDDKLKINASNDNYTGLGQVGLMTWTETSESFFDDVKVCLDGTDPPNLVKGLEETILPSDSNPNPVVNYRIFIPIGIGIAVCAIGIVVVSARRSHYAKAPKRRQVSYKLVLLHVNNLSASDLPEMDKISSKPESLAVVEEKPDEKSIKRQVEEIHTLGTQMLFEGAYLEVIKHFDSAAAMFFKYGFQNHALSFLERADVIRKLNKEREHLINVLEIQKLGKDYEKIQNLYAEIIEISKALYDSDAIEMYQNELEEFKSKLPKVKDSEDLKPVKGGKRPLSLSKASDLYNQLQNFAIGDLERKRQKMESKAKFLEAKQLFQAAALFYKNCEEISVQLVQLGKTDEKVNLDRYREKKLQCSNKISVHHGGTE